MEPSSPKDYSFLLDVFYNFLQEEHLKAEEKELCAPFLRPWIDPETKLNKPIMEPKILREFGYSEDFIGHRAFLNAVIEPFRKLELSEITLLMNALNSYVGQNKSIRFRVEKTKHDRAIDWLWIDINELNLPRVTLFRDPFEWMDKVPITEANDYENYIKPLEFLPFKQCYYCGKPLRKAKGGE